MSAARLGPAADEDLWMDDRVFPSFPAGIDTRFQAVKMTAGFDIRGYLEDPKCPYPQVLKNVLTAWLLREAPDMGTGTGTGGGSGGNLAVAPLFQEGTDQTDEMRADGVLEEIQRTVDTLRNIERSLEADDTDGKLNIIKQKTALLERWVALKQGAFGIKQMGEFIRLVLGVLETQMDKDEIAKFKEKMSEIYDNS